MIAENGLYQTINMIDSSWRSKGYRTSYTDSYKLPVLKVSGFSDGAQIIYTFLQSNRMVFVKVVVPEYSVSYEGSAYFNEPKQLYQQRPVAPQNVPGAPAIYSIKQFAGFELATDRRSQSGYMLINEVANGTAAYYAGMRRGDILLKIDAYETKNYDVSWMNSYVADRYRSKALLKVRFLHSGKEKTVSIQL
jgi:membrane-associated protease RseP (regulator of RpoE activity)